MMRQGFSQLLKKDFRLMLSGRFFLLALASLVLYSCYIHFVYAKVDQVIYPVYLFDPQGMLDTQSNLDSQDNSGSQDTFGSQGTFSSQGNFGSQNNSGSQGNFGSQNNSGSQGNFGSQDNSGSQGASDSQGNFGSQGNSGSQGRTDAPCDVNSRSNCNSRSSQTARSDYITEVDSREALEAACEDRYSVGIDLSSGTPEFYLLSSGIRTADNYRAIWAQAVLAGNLAGQAEVIGTNSREMKNRREITAEFLFFELSAVGFLGLASLLFKEKQMGVIRVHGILPVNRTMFILSKLSLFLVSDLVFASLLTLINLGPGQGAAVLPAVLLQTGILSLIMALTGFFCAVRLPDFKQFSLLYLILAVFITTPVFLAGQTGLSGGWIDYHPMYHLFKAMKGACFLTPNTQWPYYAACLGTILLLFLLAHRTLTRELAREG